MMPGAVCGIPKPKSSDDGWYEAYLKVVEKNKRLIIERDEARDAVIQHCQQIVELQKRLKKELEGEE